MPHRNYGSIGFSPCRMPEGEEIDAVTGAAVEKPTPELEELRELDELVEQQKDHELNFWMKLKGYEPEKLEKLFEIGARKRPEIKLLNTQFGNIGTVGFLKIANYLPKFQNLKAIYLDRCPIGDDGIAALCPAVQATKIERLWLGGCDIGDAGAEMLAESMPKWPEFLYLQLSGNPIGDVGACALFKHVYTGPLLQLYMHKTNLTVVSAAALLDAQLECRPRDDGPRVLGPSHGLLEVRDSRDEKSIIISLDPKAISKTSWRTHGWIPNKELFAEANFVEGSWDYGPIQRKMLELKEKKVPLKTSEEKCCVLQ